MNKDKQIEEMAKDLQKHSFFYNGGCLMNYSTTAKLLYNAGYRKASEVAREIFEEIEEVLMLDLRCDNYFLEMQSLSIYRTMAALKIKHTGVDFSDRLNAIRRRAELLDRSLKKSLYEKREKWNLNEMKL